MLALARGDAYVDESVLARDKDLSGTGGFELILQALDGNGSESVRVRLGFTNGLVGAVINELCFSSPNSRNATC
jgi:fructose-specific phosphotransferase system IIC component